MTNKEPEILTMPEAAAYLQISPDYMLRLLRDGTIPGVKLGKAWRIVKADISPALRELAKKGNSNAD